jgi:hypothetical protein
MAINNYHTVDLINGKRCAIVEKNVSAERAAYIKSILEANKYVVESESNAAGLITIGVTDIKFSIVYSIYSCTLRNTDRKIVTPSLWYNQTQNEGFYWENR